MAPCRMLNLMLNHYFTPASIAFGHPNADLSGTFLKPLMAWGYPNNLPFVPKRRCLLVHNICVLFSVSNHPKNKIPEGTPLRVHSRTQPIPGSIISRAGIMIRVLVGSSTPTASQVRVRVSLVTICSRIVIITL